jgi:hypothetical protein
MGRPVRMVVESRAIVRGYGMKFVRFHFLETSRPQRSKVWERVGKAGMQSMKG